MLEQTLFFLIKRSPEKGGIPTQKFTHPEIVRQYKQVVRTWHFQESVTKPSVKPG